MSPYDVEPYLQLYTSICIQYDDRVPLQLFSCTGIVDRTAVPATDRSSRAVVFWVERNGWTNSAPLRALGLPRRRRVVRVGCRCAVWARWAVRWVGY